MLFPKLVQRLPLVNQRLILTVIMSDASKKQNNTKRRPQSGYRNRKNSNKDEAQGRQSHAQQSRNMHTTPKSNIWPSNNHRCVLFFHQDEALSLTDIKTILQPLGGQIIAMRRKILSNNVMSTVEMSTAEQAENIWKNLKENKPKGVNTVVPDMMHKVIERYEPYWDEDRINNGLEDGSLISGSLKMNPRQYFTSYISDGKNPDILLDSVVARNRALSGDVVAVKLRSPDKWLNVKGDKGVEVVSEFMSNLSVSSDKPVQNKNSGKKTKTGDVVGILEKRHGRVCVGFLKDIRNDKVLFTPVDHCVPRILIPIDQCPPEFLKRGGDFADKLFMASIVKWDDNDMFAQGELSKYIGDRGEIEPETTRILLEHGVDHSAFPQTVNDSLPVDLPWKVPQQEYSNRRDLTKECIFTIDPATAKDLDDALHCKKIGDDLYEVGVHIADVSHFVKPRTEVDEIAAKRCTSVYLVQRVIPMLPTLLCEELCSLNPGKDRLTFSVIWKMTSDGKIVDEWFGKTVIHSCIKMSYEHAQSFIENPEKEFDEKEFPEISASYNLKEIRTKVLDLHKISQSLRSQRFDDGALRLDQIKLSYTLDKETGMPNSCFTYEYKASNALIEEFMLLANMAVATKLRNSLPDHAFLRCHPEPKDDMLKNIATYCSENGWKLDVSSSKALADSLRAAAESDELADHCILGLQMLAIKPQELAIYFCTGCVDDEEKFRHYALNVPLYTHFTSPIRRYADVIVHRQLSAALGDTGDIELASMSSQDLQKQADACNVRKSEAKRVQDLSTQLFFYALVKGIGSLEAEAVVMYVYDHSFDVLSIKYGQVHRIYLDAMPIVGSKLIKLNTEIELLWPCVKSEQYKLTNDEKALKKKGKLKLPKYNETITQKIKVFSTVDIVLEPNTRTCQVCAFLRRPTDA
ncbi:DIS3-like exonuclease 2 [Styela clava]